MYRQALAATALLALGAGPAAAAPPAHSGKAAPATVAYQFRGVLTSANPSSVALTVRGGNRAGMRLMIGAANPATFTIGSTTKVILWTANASGRNVPALGAEGNLTAGDRVMVTVRAPRHATLAQVEAAAAARVGDFAAAVRPPGKLFLLAGRVTGVDAAAHTISVDVKRGNRRGLHAMLGQATVQTFTYSVDTVFLHWNSTGPHIIGADALKVGDPVTLRIRAKAGSSLATLEGTELWRVNDHEPTASMDADQNA